jgi:uncharacterized membrane protein YhhN
VLPLAYGVIAAANVVASGVDDPTWARATKPGLMPLLAATLWVAARHRGLGGYRLILAGLGFAAVGDVTLMFAGPTPFVLGMVMFAGCHVCYIAAFVRAGEPRRRGVAAAYAVVTLGVLAWLWSGLGGLAVPIAVYAVLLATMASTASGYGWRVGLGGGLFLVSDLMIAARVAGAGELPFAGAWVMLTYTAAQALIVIGWVARLRDPVRRSLEQAVAHALHPGGVQAKAGGEIAINAAVPSLRGAERIVQVDRTRLQQRQQESRIVNPAGERGQDEGGARRVEFIRTQIIGGYDVAFDPEGREYERGEPAGSVLTGRAMEEQWERLVIGDDAQRRAERLARRRSLHEPTVELPHYGFGAAVAKPVD